MTFYRIPWTGIEVRRNVLPNPSGRVNTVGYTAIGTGASLGMDPGADTYSITAVGGQGRGNFGIRVASLTVGTNIEPNAAYIYTAGMYAADSGQRPVVMFATGSGVAVPGEGTFPPSDFARNQITFTTGASGQVDLYVLNEAVTVAGTNIVAFRDALVEKASTFDPALPYFAGHFADTIDRHYEWTGAANNSASVVMIPAASDVLDPTLGILVPHVVTREARSVVQLLAESSDPTVTFVPPGPRSGVMSSVFADPAKAFAAMAWFSGNFDYVYVQDDATYANMRFRVADGEIEVEQTDAGTLLRVPFVEIAGAVS